MTNLRQAAMQALEALRSSTDYRSGSAIQVEAVENLCEALEQPEQEPKHVVKSNGRHSPLLTHMMHKRDTTPPAAQPDYEFDYKLALNEWLDKTEWVQEKINSGHLGVRYLGMHRADVLRDLAYPNTVTGKAPQQRPWVGLTDEDVNRESSVIDARLKLAFHSGMYVAQKILKERNT
jgi:hypothetical protein